MGLRSIHVVAVTVLLMAIAGQAPALADTIEAALVRAYQGNPQLNAQRAQVRSTDENVSQALAGYRPQAAITTSAGYQYTDTYGIAVAAEGEVHGAREGLRVLEQTVLLNAATIYMDYLRDGAIVEVQRSNTRVLQETLAQTQERFRVGELTNTDVAQADAQLAAGKTQELAAEATLTTTRSNFRRIIGNEPQALAPSRR
jgi:outer membrane protein